MGTSGKLDPERPAGCPRPPEPYDVAVSQPPQHAGFLRSTQSVGQGGFECTIRRHACACRSFSLKLAWHLPLRLSCLMFTAEGLGLARSAVPQSLAFRAAGSVAHPQEGELHVLILPNVHHLGL